MLVCKEAETIFLESHFVNRERHFIREGVFIPTSLFSIGKGYLGIYNEHGMHGYIENESEWP